MLKVGDRVKVIEKRKYIITKYNSTGKIIKIILSTAVVKFDKMTGAYSKNNLWQIDLILWTGYTQNMPLIT